MQDLIDDLKQLKQELTCKIISTTDEDTKQELRNVRDELTNIILQHEEFTVPF